MSEHDQDALDRLNRDWNDLVSPTTPDQEAESDLTDAVRRLHAHDDAPAITPAFRQQLRRDLIAQAHATTTSPNGASHPFVVATYAPVVEPELLSSPGTARRLVRHWWPIAELAAAILVIAALGAAVVGYRNLPLIRDRGSAPSGWSMYRGGPGRTGAVAGPGLDRAPGFLWTFTSDAPEHPAFAIAGDTLYLTGDERNVSALDARTGAERWRAPVPGTAGVVPAVADGTVYVGNKDGTLFALDATTGSERWRFATGGAIRGSPAVVAGVVYVGSSDGTFYALDAVSGERRWIFHLDGVIWSTPALADGTVYVGNDQHMLYALDAATGARRWEFKTRGSGVVPAPAVAGGTVYVATWGGALYAIDAATGDQRWMFVADGAVYSPTVAGDLVVTGSDDGNVYAVDVATGAERWRFATEDRVFAQPVVADGTVYVGSLDGRIYALDLATGGELWRVGVARVGYGPVLFQGRLYIVAVDGRLLALGDEPGATPLIGTPSAVTAICGCSTKEPWLR